MRIHFVSSSMSHCKIITKVPRKMDKRSIDMQQQELCRSLWRTPPECPAQPECPAKSPQSVRPPSTGLENPLVTACRCPDRTTPGLRPETPELPRQTRVSAAPTPSVRPDRSLRPAYIEVSGLSESRTHEAHWASAHVKPSSTKLPVLCQNYPLFSGWPIYSPSPSILNPILDK